MCESQIKTGEERKKSECEKGRIGQVRREREVCVVGRVRFVVR